MSSFSTYLYLLRVPLLSWILVLVFGPLAMRVGLLRNLLLSGVPGETWTLLLAMLVCRSAQASAMNIVNYGSRRFRVRFQPPGWIVLGIIGGACGWFGSGVGFLFAAFSALAYTMVAGSWGLALFTGFIALFAFLVLSSWWGAVIGAGMFIGLVWFINTLGDSYQGADRDILGSDSKVTAAVVEVFLFGAPAIVLSLYMATYSRLGLGLEIVPLTIAFPLSFLMFWVLPKFVVESHASEKFDGWGRALLSKLPRLGRWRWFRNATVTLLDFDRDGGVIGVPSGHWPLVALNGLAIISFVGLSRAKSAYLAAGQPGDVPGWSPATAPALAFVFLGLAILCLAGSFLTFWFDRFRVPVILPVALLTWLGSTPATDHVFAVRENPVSGRPTARSLIEGHDNVILVAAAGGGVQAAGWTARVLEGLRAENKDFTTAVRAISSVSGGAVGSMYYIESLLENNSNPGLSFTSAVSPSLEIFSWALFSRDLPTALFGPFVQRGRADRAAAFEDVLARRAHLKDVWISDWSRKTGTTLPAVLFNAFEVETGKPVVISTSDFPPKPNFVDLNARFDLRLVTAARLSSSFSYVSPVARPDVFALHPHIADGGYFDNFGLVSLTEWLRAGLAGGATPNVMIIKIVSFPKDPDPNLSPKGWGYQLYAPELGIWNMRGMAQWVRGDSELELLAKFVKLDVVEFRFEGKDACGAPPLSWDLSPDEVNCLGASWNLQSEPRKKVTAFLANQKHQ